MTGAGAQYEIEHVTRFRYSEPVREAVMTLYLQPVNDASQHLEAFSLGTDPAAELSEYRDCFGNPARFFDVPSEHSELSITARSLVALHPAREPEGPGPSWDDLRGIETSSAWHWLHPTPRTRPTATLADFVSAHGIDRGDTPLSTVRETTGRIYEALGFRPGATAVDSPIDDALERGAGVCQDFTHIMLAILRGWGFPARYVSGYLFPRRGGKEDLMAGAGHAWVECLLPGLGWIAADPTNNTVSGDEHIRVAHGRDYGDVPPTRGTFRGVAEQSMEVTVNIGAADAGKSARRRSAAG